MSEKRTDLPWVVDPEFSDVVRRSDGRIVAVAKAYASSGGPKFSDADTAARDIVLAVNAHDQMLEALMKAQVTLVFDGVTDDRGRYIGRTKEAIEMINAAIAAAEGGGS